MEKETKKEKANYKELFTYLKKTYEYSKDKKRYLVYFLIGNIVISIISVLSPLCSAKQIVYLTTNIYQKFIFMTIAILVLELARNLCYFLDNMFINKYFVAVKRNIQLDLAKETLKINTEVLNNNSSGVFIERITSDADSLADIFTNIIDYVTYLITMIGIFVSIFFLNKTIFILYFIYILSVYFMQKYASNKIQEKRRAEKEIGEKCKGFVTELVRGAKDVKMLNAEDSFIEKGKEYIEELNDASINLWNTRSKFRLFRGNTSDILDFAIMIAGIYFILKGNLEVGTMIIILNYRSGIMSIANNLEGFYELVKKYTLASERVFDILDGNKFKKEEFGTKNINKITGDIEFKNVHFSYNENTEVLKDISFKIKANETISFVGKSGSGKSTIFNLIAGLYYPNAGEILIDGISNNELSKDSLRGNISIISQNPYIFNMSIKDNLKIIKSDLTEEEMIEACKLAHLHDYIMTLKDGYDTVVGESGVTLSGGQRQRLAIARALVQKTEIILFDEATSALDNETQSKIQKSIENMQGEYTILIIAHRLSTVINSDRLILIDDGKVVGMGSHEYLLKTNKFYQKLYELELKETKNK